MLEKKIQILIKENETLAEQSSSLSLSLSSLQSSLNESQQLLRSTTETLQQKEQVEMQRRVHQLEEEEVMRESLECLRMSQEEEKRKEILQHEKYLFLQSDFNESQRVILELRQEIECSKVEMNTLSLERRRDKEVDEGKIRDLELLVEDLKETIRNLEKTVEIAFIEKALGGQQEQVQQQERAIQTDDPGDMSLLEDQREIWIEKVKEIELALAMEKEKREGERENYLNLLSAREKDFQSEMEMKLFLQKQTTTQRLEETSRSKDEEIERLEAEVKELLQRFNTLQLEFSDALGPVATTDAGTDAGPGPVATTDAGTDAGPGPVATTDAGTDAGPGPVATSDAGTDAGPGPVATTDAGTDAGPGPVATTDAGTSMQTPEDESEVKESLSRVAELENQVKVNEQLREHIAELEERILQLERATLGSSVSPSKLKRLNTKMISPNYFIYDAKLRDRFYDKGGVIVYQILVLALDHVEWEVNRRYSAFKEIHDKIAAKTSIVIGRFYPAPPPPSCLVPLPGHF
jgi:hypothetical protein